MLNYKTAYVSCIAVIYIPDIYIIDGESSAKASDEYLSSHGIYPQYLVDGDLTTTVTLPPPGVTQVNINLVLPRTVWTKLKVVVDVEQNVICHPRNIFMMSSDIYNGHSLCVAEYHPAANGNCNYLCHCSVSCDSVQLFLNNVFMTITEISYLPRKV